MIQSIERVISSDFGTSTRSQSYQYNAKGTLLELTRQSLVATFEYNARGLATQMDYGNASSTQTAYVWKYTRNILSEVEVHQNGTRAFSYFFFFDHKKRLTKISSDNPDEYIYLFEYKGKSRNPSKRLLHYVLQEGDELPGYLPGDEFLVQYTDYQYDSKRHPETILKGFQVSPDNLGRILEPIPENNIIQEDLYDWDIDPDSGEIIYRLSLSLSTLYTYNTEGFPVDGISVPLGDNPTNYQIAYTFTYQDCKKVLD